MNSRLWLTLFLSCIAIAFSLEASALPKLDDPVPLDAKFEGIITIYPDNYNTDKVQNFWIVPSTARIVRNPDQKLAFGLVHSGISSFDPDGISALLTATFQPYVDDVTVQAAKKIISDSVAAAGGQAYFRFISPKETQIWLMVGGQFLNWNPLKPDQVIAGGAVEAGIPFQIKVHDSTDARALAQFGGGDTNTIGVMYRMKFEGTRSRCHFEVIGKFKETYEHFKTAISGSAWWGITKASAAYELQTLKSNDAVTIKLHQCTQETFDKYYPVQAVEGLLTQLAARTGAFARTLKANGLPDAPGGGGSWGWSLSVGGGFEKYDEEREIKYEYDLNFIKEQEIAFGMTFPSDGPQLKPYVKNLSDSNKPFPTAEDFKSIMAQHGQCRKANIAALMQLRADGAINDEQLNRFTERALERGCYVNYSLDHLRELIAGKVGKATLENVSFGDILEAVSPP